jgi:hypothetical protein
VKGLAAWNVLVWLEAWAGRMTSFSELSFTSHVWEGLDLDLDC